MGDPLITTCQPSCFCSFSNLLNSLQPQGFQTAPLQPAYQVLILPKSTLPHHSAWLIPALRAPALWGLPNSRDTPSPAHCSGLPILFLQAQSTSHSDNLCSVVEGLFPVLDENPTRERQYLSCPAIWFSFLVTFVWHMTQHLMNTLIKISPLNTIQFSAVGATPACLATFSHSFSA